MRSVVERSDHHEVTISTRVVYGHPAKALIDESGDDRLLGSRGRGALAGLILGSVSQACAQYTRGPVIVVRGSAPTDGIGRVVVGVDGSADSLARPAVRGGGGTATRGATGGRARLARDRSRGARAIGTGRREREGAGGSGMAEHPEIDPGCRPGCGDHQQTRSRDTRSRCCSRPPKELRCWWWGRVDAEAGRDSCWDRSRCAASPCPRAR